MNTSAERLNKAVDACKWVPLRAPEDIERQLPCVFSERSGQNEVNGSIGVFERAGLSALVHRATSAPPIPIASAVVAVALLAYSNEALFSVGYGSSLGNDRFALLVLGLACLSVALFLPRLVWAEAHQAARTGFALTSSCGGALVLEYVAFHWPNNSPLGAVQYFMNGNLIVLVFALLYTFVRTCHSQLRHPLVHTGRL